MTTNEKRRSAHGLTSECPGIEKGQIAFAFRCWKCWRAPCVCPQGEGLRGPIPPEMRADPGAPASNDPVQAAAKALSAAEALGREDASRKSPRMIGEVVQRLRQASHLIPSGQDQAVYRAYCEARTAAVSRAAVEDTKTMPLPFEAPPERELAELRTRLEGMERELAELRTRLAGAKLAEQVRDELADMVRSLRDEADACGLVTCESEADDGYCGRLALPCSDGPALCRRHQQPGGGGDPGPAKPAKAARGKAPAAPASR